MEGVFFWKKEEEVVGGREEGFVCVFLWGRCKQSNECHKYERKINKINRSL